jgi:hypothetical protein
VWQFVLSHTPGAQGRGRPLSVREPWPSQWLMAAADEISEDARTGAAARTMGGRRVGEAPELVTLLTGHSPDGFVFPGLVVGGPDENRSCLA